MKKKLFLCGLAMIMIGGSAWADEASVDVMPHLSMPILQKQVNAKRLYREARDVENSIPLSAIDQIEYFQVNNPGLDEDTMKVVKQGTELMKKMKFGLKDADVAKDSILIRQNPTKVITEISDSTITEATPTDAMSAIDLMEPSKRMMEKVLHDKELGRKGYQINIDSF